jgi:hypothetical protein
MRDNITTIMEAPSPYGHCATICPHRNGVLIAFYLGPECRNQQRVVLQYWVGTEKLSEYLFYNKTGNCVLWAINEDWAGLIYSYFNDTDGINYPAKLVHRWMYCSNWRVKVQADKDVFTVDSPVQLDLQPPIGYLARCAPIKVGRELILPMYREKCCHGQMLMSENGWDWWQGGAIGMDVQGAKLGKGYLIQPTIWHDGKTLHSLSRNSKSGGRQAWYSRSPDHGHSWSQPRTAKVSNTNNSLVALHNGTDAPWLVWNKGNGRHTLVLGRWIQEELTAIPYLKLNAYANASYPNYCVDHKGLTHIVHTDGGRIAHHIIQPQLFEELAAGPAEMKSLHKPKSHWGRTG